MVTCNVEIDCRQRLILQQLFLRRFGSVPGDQHIVIADADDGDYALIIGIFVAQRCKHSD